MKISAEGKGGSAARRAFGQFRWVVCALLFLATAINYMDRQVLGLLKPVLDQEIGWSQIDYANVVTSFQVAYAIGLLGFGPLVDFLGTRRGYALSVVWWSLAAAGHGLARSAFGFGVARFALGVGEAGNFPAAVKAVSEWFPRRERALANGLFNSGSNVGAILAPALVPWLTVCYGWQGCFVALGAVGIVWLGAWLMLYDAPERSRWVSAAEFAHIRSDPPEPATAKVPFFALLGYRQTWVLIVGFAFTAPIWWFYLYWLPDFFNNEYGLNLKNLGPPLIVIYTMTCFGSVGGGWLSSALLRRGWSVNASRKTAMLVSALCVVPVIFAAKAANLWLATALVGLAASAHQGWAANLFALVSDLFPKRTVASVVGLASLAGSLAAIVFSQMAGRILEFTGSYWSLFAIASGAYLVALFIMNLLSPRLAPADFKPMVPAGKNPDDPDLPAS